MYHLPAWHSQSYRRHDTYRVTSSYSVPLTAGTHPEASCLLIDLEDVIWYTLFRPIPPYVTPHSRCTLNYFRNLEIRIHKLGDCPTVGWSYRLPSSWLLPGSSRTQTSVEWRIDICLTGVSRPGQRSRHFTPSLSSVPQQIVFPLSHPTSSRA